MEKDFYLGERSLSAYLEKDWFDLISRDAVPSPSFAFAPFDGREIYSPYHEKLALFVKAILEHEKIRPAEMFEVGSSLGRTFYEFSRRLPSLRMATLLEPSRNLSSLFQKIFLHKEPTSISLLKGNEGTQELVWDAKNVRKECSHIEISHLEVEFAKIPSDLGPFDLVICSNVVDQCHEPENLVRRLIEATRTGGVLVLSCTYQWQDKYIGNAGVQIRDIGELFDSSWRPLGETNIPFRLRKNERHWLDFLSHVGVYQKQ